ncbi:MAG: hypothetical protein WBE69_18805, partial [Candidatus Binataceae bacterium]
SVIISDKIERKLFAEISPGANPSIIQLAMCGMDIAPPTRGKNYTISQLVVMCGTDLRKFARGRTQCRLLKPISEVSAVQRRSG